MKKIINLFTMLSLMTFTVNVIAADKVIEPTWPDTSIYQLKIKLEDQKGIKEPISVFSGSPVIVSMFYSSCDYSCPVLIDTIKKTIGDLTEKQRAGVKVLLVSFDPKRDTPKVLKQLAQKHQLDETQWKLTRTSEDQTAELAAVLEIKYRKINSGDFNHTPFLGLMNAQGELIVSTENFAEGRKLIMQKLQALK